MISEQLTLNRFTILRIYLSGTTIHRTTVNQNSSNTRRHEVNEAQKAPDECLGRSLYLEKVHRGTNHHLQLVNRSHTHLKHKHVYTPEQRDQIQKQFRYIEYLKVITILRSGSSATGNCFSNLVGTGSNRHVVGLDAVIRLFSSSCPIVVKHCSFFFG